MWEPTRSLFLFGLIFCVHAHMVLYLQQSRILKHAGDMEAAAAMADEARRLDLADRYINSECVWTLYHVDSIS